MPYGSNCAPFPLTVYYIDSLKPVTAHHLYGNQKQQQSAYNKQRRNYRSILPHALPLASALRGSPPFLQRIWSRGKGPHPNKSQNVRSEAQSGFWQ